jgi:transcriptional antiterminator NusG
MNWHALLVETGKEELVRKIIFKYMGDSVVDVVIPKRRLQERKQGKTYEVFKNMFPGYLLVNARMHTKTFNNLKRMPIFNRLLHKYDWRNKNEVTTEDTFEENLLSKIDKEEMTLLLQLIDDNGIINYSTICVINAKVKVIDGPLKGMDGLIKKLDRRKNRARIAINFMGTEKRLDVGIEMLKSIQVDKPDS